MKETTLYAEKYRKGSARVKPHLNPTLPYIAAGFTVHEAYLLEAGRVRCTDGVEREFQTLKIYFNETQLEPK